MATDPEAQQPANPSEGSCVLNSLPGACVPCTGATPQLTVEEILHYSQEVPDWDLRPRAEDGVRVIQRMFRFRNYVQTMAFLSSLTEVFEREAHHADHRLYDYRKLEFTITTHAIKGLSVNDFVLARLIDQAYAAFTAANGR